MEPLGGGGGEGGAALCSMVYKIHAACLETSYIQTLLPVSGTWGLHWSASFPWSSDLAPDWLEGEAGTHQAIPRWFLNQSESASVFCHPRSFYCTVYTVYILLPPPFSLESKQEFSFLFLLCCQQAGMDTGYIRNGGRRNTLQAGLNRFQSILLCATMD